MKQFKGVGAIIFSESTGKVMTVLRSQIESHPYTWTFAGGRVENDETSNVALLRELKEELNLVNIKKVLPLHCYQSRKKDFVYDTFIVLVNDEFTPLLNDENIGYAWTDIDNLPSPLHPKTRQMLSSSRLREKFKNFNLWIDRKNDGKNHQLPKETTT